MRPVPVLVTGETDRRVEVAEDMVVGAGEVDLEGKITRRAA